MKKIMNVGVAAVLAASVVNAQEGVNGSDPQVTVEGALVSSQVWRGQVQNNDLVFQPQLTVAQYGVSLNIWANYDLGKNMNGIQNDVSEIDLSLAYSLPLNINEMAIDVGIINYNFPGNGPGNTGDPSTTEIFAKATVLSWQDYVIPSVTFFGDIDEADGTYILFDVVAPYQVSDYLAVEAGFSAGWGNTSYNDYYFSPNGVGDQDEGWNDYNFYARGSYELAENLTVAASMQYTMLEGGALRSGAEDIYEDDNKFVVGVNLAYDF